MQPSAQDNPLPASDGMVSFRPTPKGDAGSLIGPPSMTTAARATRRARPEANGDNHSKVVAASTGRGKKARSVRQTGSQQVDDPLRNLMWVNVIHVDDDIGRLVGEDPRRQEPVQLPLRVRLEQ